MCKNGRRSRISICVCHHAWHTRPAEFIGTSIFIRAASPVMTVLLRVTAPSFNQVRSWINPLRIYPGSTVCLPAESGGVLVVFDFGSPAFRCSLQQRLKSVANGLHYLLFPCLCHTLAYVSLNQPHGGLREPRFAVQSRFQNDQIVCAPRFCRRQQFPCPGSSTPNFADQSRSPILLQLPCTSSETGVARKGTEFAPGQLALPNHRQRPRAD